MKKPLIEGDDYYLNEQGCFVFTAKHHLQRGYCCSLGCIHCPFDYEAVSEPKRSELLLNRSHQDQSSK